MPYEKIIFNNQAPPGLSAERLAHMQTQYDEAVGDIENADRTLDPNQAPAGNIGPLQAILNWFANRIKAITGKTYWWEAPDTTLAAAKNHIDDASPHPGHALASDLASHLAESASETVKGHVELATAAETTAGTDNTRAVHPAGLKVELDKKVSKAGDTMTAGLVVDRGASYGNMFTGKALGRNKFLWDVDSVGVVRLYRDNGTTWAEAFQVDSDAVLKIGGNKFWHDGLGAKSFGVSGYAKLPNGLIFQWTTQSLTAGAVFTWTFPLAFPTACIALHATPINNSISNVISKYDVNYPTTTQGQFLSDSTVSHYLLAIGY
jgi:hypothetical protein